MSESFQHGSRDERRNGSSGDRRSGGGTGRDGDRSGPASRRRTDDGRRHSSRDARDNDRSAGEARGRGSEARKDSAPTGNDRRDDRRGGYAPRSGDRRDEDRRGGYGGDRRGEDRGGRDDRRGGYAPRGGDRREDRAGERGPRRDGEGYRGQRDDRRDDRRGGYAPRAGDRRDDDRRGGYGGDRRREDRGGRDDRRGGHAPRDGDRRGGFPDRSEGYRGRRDDRDDVSTHRHRAPEVDEDITGRELDKPTRAQLGALEPRNADAVAKHLVMAGRYLLDDPALALEHAQAAGRRGGRIAAVREATGIAAYEAGDFGLALKELRTFRRMTGAEIHLPLMVDCERALGRLDKAAELATSEAVDSLESAEKVELAIVLAGMRRDQGDAQGVVDALTIPQLDKNRGFPYSPRLFRAYAEALRGVGRDREALTWDRQAVVAEAALGTGQFAEPEIIDFDDEEETGPVPANGVGLADAEEPIEESAGESAGEPDAATTGVQGAGEATGADGGDRPDHESDDEPDDVLDEGADEEPEESEDQEDVEEDLDPDDDFGSGSEADLDPDDDAELVDLGGEDASDGEDGGPQHG